MKVAYAMVAAVVILFSFAGCCTAPRASAWEYRDVNGYGDAVLNEQAAQGWILVTAYFESHSNTIHYVFKRPKRAK